jgi:hypothetical protein
MSSSSSSQIPAQGDEWNDLKPLLKELENLFSSDKDLVEINTIKELTVFYQQLVPARVKDARDLIKRKLLASCSATVVS